MAAFDFTTGSLPAGASITRSGNGTRVNVAGARVTETTNVARLDFDALSHAARGILVEADSTNTELWSQDFSNAAYTLLAATALASGIRETATTASHGVYQNMIITSGVISSGSVEASELVGSAKRYLILRMTFTAGGVLAAAVFDLAAGTFIQGSGLVGASMIPAVGGGYLCSIWATQTSTGSANTFEIYLSNAYSITVPSYLGVTTSGMNLTEFQLEQVPTPTSRIRTTTAAAARNADTLTLNWGSLGVANGAQTVRYTFADGTFQDLAATVAGGNASVSGNALAQGTLARAEIFTTLFITASGTPTTTAAAFTYIGFDVTGTMDVQVSPTSDFAFAVAPIYNVTPSAGTYTIAGLNQRATYYVRARNRSAGGVVGDWSNTIAFRTADGAAQTTTPAGVMITPAVVMVPEPVLSATATNTKAGFPESNVTRDSPVGWKASPSVGGSWNFDAQLAGAPVDTIAVLNTNLPESATVTIYAAPTQAGLTNGVGRVAVMAASPFRASSNMPGRRGYHGLFQFASTSMAWWRIVFTAATTADTIYVEHILFGKSLVSKNHSIDKSETPMPKGTIERTRSGVADRVDGIPMRRVEFDISVMTEQDYETKYGRLYHKENAAVLVVPNMRSGAFLHDRILYGDMKGSRIYNPTSSRFTRSFAVESII